jgi:uridine kinase
VPCQQRAQVLEALGQELRDQRMTHPLRVAIDGITAAGKSTLAGELATAIRSRGRRVVRLSMDDFHNSRACRYRLGRRSAEGYYDDAFDFKALAEDVLKPLGEHPNPRYRRRLRDLTTDDEIEHEWELAASDSIVLVDGTFLQRPEIAALWDTRIFVATSFAVALQRAIGRDAELFGGAEETARIYGERYHAACRHYLQSVDPGSLATYVIDNDDPARPRLIRN